LKNKQNQFSIRESSHHIMQLVCKIWKTQPIVATIWAAFLLFSAAFPVLQIWLQKTSVDAISKLGEKAAELSHVVFWVLFL
jgi:hypothetical protein